MVTMKFGGTSVQDAEAISRVVRIVRGSLDKHPVVVVSAVAQATNILENIGRSAEAGATSEALTSVAALMERHHAIVAALITDPRRKEDLLSYLARATDILRNLAEGVGRLRELTPRIIDALCSQGELLSSRIVAAALEEQGVPAVWLDTADFLVTDNSHTRARPQMSLVRERLLGVFPPLLDAGKVPVTQGFIGATIDGTRTTMGRESSDYTGALIGGILGADAIEIWTDVTGVSSADPRHVKGTRQIGHLSFDEAFELTYYGAKVLHPKTMEPARENNVPIHILNSRHPELPGTIVSSGRDNSPPGVKSVTSRRNIGVLTVSPRERHGQYIFREQIYAVLTENRVEALMSASSEYRVVFVCGTAEVTPTVLRSLGEVGHVEFVPGRGLLCMVGREIVKTPRLAARFFAAVGDHPVSFFCYGPSGNSLGVVLDESEVGEAVRRVHEEFFEPDGRHG